MKHTIDIPTSQKIEVINVTHQIADLVTGLDDGLVYVSLPHTTAALIVNEDDAELRADIAHTAAHLLDDLEPFTHARRGNSNAAAHIFSALAGASLTLAVEGGRLALGTYQNVLLIELDGPKTRELSVRLWALPAS
jgi:secondary thiamine-phosphate synthase enzyme